MSVLLLAIETKCVDSENLNEECSAATELVGGSLACTENHKKCCCRAKKCQIQFENFFFKQGELGKSRISEPYLIEPEDSKALPVLTNLGVYVCVILFVYVWWYPINFINLCNPENQMMKHAISKQKSSRTFIALTLNKQLSTRKM